MTTGILGLSRPALLLVMALSWSCTPSAEQCRAFIPTAITAASAGENVAGDKTCIGSTQDGIRITVSLEREGLGWKRERLWIEDQEVTLEDFQGELEALRFRKAAAAAGQKAKEMGERAVEAFRAFVEGSRK